MTDTASPARAGWRADLRFLALLALGVVTLHTVVGQPFYMPSESMMPTLMTGDRLVVSKYPYGWSYTSPSLPILPRIAGRLWERLPRRGDVVILTPPAPDRRGEVLIKRVIGLPGDTVRMVAGRLWLNGRRVPAREMGPRDIATDGNFGCEGRVRNGRCRLDIVREALPGGAHYDTIDLGRPGSTTPRRTACPPVTSS